VIFLTFSSYLLISTIPPALSTIGPKPLIDRMKIPVVNIPIVATAVPNSPPIGLSSESVKPEASPNVCDTSRAVIIISTGIAVLSMPTANPYMILVAGPVLEALTILYTGP
jgi:hypothetical protein